MVSYAWNVILDLKRGNTCIFRYHGEMIHYVCVFCLVKVIIISTWIRSLVGIKHYYDFCYSSMTHHSWSNLIKDHSKNIIRGWRLCNFHGQNLDTPLWGLAESGLNPSKDWQNPYLSYFSFLIISIWKNVGVPPPSEDWQNVCAPLQQIVKSGCPPQKPPPSTMFSEWSLIHAMHKVAGTDFFVGYF